MNQPISDLLTRDLERLEEHSERLAAANSAKRLDNITNMPPVHGVTDKQQQLDSSQENFNSRDWELVDESWETVDSEEPTQAAPVEEPVASLVDFRDDLLRDQEDAIELNPQFPELYLKLLQLVVRADGYRERIPSSALQSGKANNSLESMLTNLEQACTRVREYIEGAETAGEQEEPTILDEPPAGMTGSWGEIEMPTPDVSTNESIAEYADKELELMLDDFVLAMGFFWDEVDDAVSCDF